MNKETILTRVTLVTGGAGFIGSHLTDELINRGEHVIILDDLSSGRETNVPHGAELVVGSVLDTVLVDELVARSSSIFHLAALVSVQDCINDWLRGHHLNLGGTIMILDAARRNGTPPVIYASSAAVYGDQGSTICSEDITPTPISPYGADKLACEHQARAFSQIYCQPSLGLRFFNVYGPRQDPRSPYAGVISKFHENIVNGKPHKIFGDGRQVRDFIFVSDIVNGLLSARDHADRNKGAAVTNLCTGTATSLLQLAAVLDVTADCGCTPIRHEAARVGDIRTSLGSPVKANDYLNWKAKVSLEEGLAKLWMAESC